VRQLLDDTVQIRRARREARARVQAELRQQGKLRSRWWSQLGLWGGAALGAYLLIQGDTVERVLGAGMLIAPALLTVVTCWVWWKALRMLRRSRA
jgi:hypothetical protein